jgi:CRP-like cAMP-binding protein
MNKQPKPHFILLARFSEEEQRQLERIVHPCVLGRGEGRRIAADSGGALFLKSGLLRLCDSDSIFDRVEPGRLFGEIGRAAGARVEAEEPSWVWTVPRQVLARRPELTRKLSQFTDELRASGEPGRPVERESVDLAQAALA